MGLRLFKKKTTFYFIGICGISMSALAKYVKFCGHEVNGSDLYGGEQAEKLRFLGMQVFVGAEPYLPFVETADVVVYTDAIPVENKELLHARKCGKKLYSRVEFLREVCLDFSRVIAVAGSHGKTTCTAMCAHVLQAANVPFCAHIGGEDSVMENFRFCGNEYFVTEACEYKKNLLKIPADTAILLNVDKDHLECYAGEEDLQNTFYSFCGAAKTSVVCMDDMAASKVEHAVTFSLYEKTADYRAAYLRNDKQRYSFTVFEYGNKLCRIHLKAVGRCNVYNALAAFAAMRTFGFSPQEIKAGLESFVGVKRRFEEIGRYRGADVVCDYAHHPKEIFNAVQTAKGMARGKLFVVFQPHTYSRTKNLKEEFVSVLKSVPRLMIYKTYPARERYDATGDGRALSQAVGDCLYSDNISSLRSWLNVSVSEGDFILFLGAGDIYYLAKYLVGVGGAASKFIL